MIRLTAAAVSDLERLRTFLSTQNPLAAADALVAIWSAIDDVERFPKLGMPTDDPEIRQLLIRFGKAGYVIRYVYDVTTDVIVVTRIWHSRESRE